MIYKQIGKFSPELGTQFQQIGQVLTDVCQLLREDCQLLRQFGLVAVQKSTDLVHLKNTAKKYKYLSLLAKFGFDTVENEPCKAISYILTSPRFQKQNAMHLCSKVLILQHVLLNAAVLLRCSLSNTAGIT